MSNYFQRRNLGDDAVDGPPAVAGIERSPNGGVLVQSDGGGGRVLVARPADGLVREVKTNKVVSREQTDELLETEAVRHLGDFSDEVSGNGFSIIIPNKICHTKLWNRIRFAATL